MSSRAGVALYVARKALATIPVAALVTVVVFLLSHVGPSDPAAVLAGEYGRTETFETIRRDLGLHLPLHQQFLIWLGRAIRGDLGQSIFHAGVPVTTLLAQHLGPTVSLALMTIFLAVLVGIPMGIVAGWKAGSWIDQVVMVLAVLAFSMPLFVVGYLGILAFSLGLGVLPVQGYRTIEQGVVPFLRHLLLPSATLGAVYVALIARTTRAAVIETARQDYVRTARAKGLPTLRVLLGHVLKNAALPVVTVIGTGVASLMSGVVITEAIFNIPGLGHLTASTILTADFPVIQGIVLFFSLAYVGINLLVDLAYMLLDPRIRY
jgi:peptide/nickel transport system permease protein